MSDLSRRAFLAGTAAAVAASVAAPSVHAQKRGGTLRFVPHADLKILDPIWTTAYITRNHGYMIFDTLFALDGNLKLQPQMVDKYSESKDHMKYSFTLRDGLKFHDGQPVTAEDCVASLKRWGAKDAVGRLLMAATAKMAPIDKKTFVIELESPFGLVLDALGKPSASPSFIMPARLAATDPNEQVKEVIGSGPYRFAKDEWQPGNRVVYLRNPDYVPRNENPSGAAGGKRVLVDRVEWRYIPDAATASAALEAGEVDYWENVPLDFAPRLEKNANVAVFVTDPRGSQGILRPNHLQPPFNNKKARQALLWMVDQAYYLQAVIGNPKYYKVCPGKGAPAPEGGRLRWAAHHRPRPDRLTLCPCAGAGHHRALEEDRREPGPAGHGLVHDGLAAREEGAARPGWLEHLPHLGHLVRRDDAGRGLGPGRRRGEIVVRLAHQRADGEAPRRLRARARRRQAQADRRAGATAQLRRGPLRDLGAVRGAGRLPEERPGRAPVRRHAPLEHHRLRRSRAAGRR